MPWKPKHPCGVRGCPALTDERFCPQHERQQQQRYDQARGSAAARGYDYRWRRLERSILARDPICMKCGLAPSTVADHKIPRSRGGADDPENLQGICAPCHGRKTALKDGGFGRAPAAGHMPENR